ncbi:MAG: ABC transporter ATP-binding protein/permease [Zoogloeaceae bacterium]|jgi:ATP-binding cassette subfamily B protein|nr:ABC transporter ATP-binding protein/permease [Zoogloeaceae bacterium]
MTFRFRSSNFAESRAEQPFWPTLLRFFPYLWARRGRVVAALLCLAGAKLATVGLPLALKVIIDDLAPSGQVLLLPIGLLLLYGLLRFAAALFTELREILFARVTQESIRRLALEVFRHLHALSLRFHLERQTGGISRDIERGAHAIGTLINYTLYSILPTLVEIVLVLAILIVRYDPVFALITFASLVVYIVFTLTVSNWRIQIRRRVNETDSAANAHAIDSLMNYETVKYFNNEDYEARRYDQHLRQWAEAATQSQVSLSFLNLGQQAIIVAGVTLIMWQAAKGVTEGVMSVGDLVLVNAFMMQLYMPLNFLGVVYREIRQSLADIERMFALLHARQEIVDDPGAIPLERRPQEIHFDDAHFAYDAKRPILRGVEFRIPAGHTVAVVGASGAGKSTLARLLFRFYDVTAGSIRFDGRDIRGFAQSSLRAAIGIVPQDTVLFNDTLFYNIQYGNPGASREEVLLAARAAQLDAFVARLPEGYETRVGERGLKLSGGEKQRVAIARALLKNPALLIFDEATSALDSRTEQAIQSQLEAVAQGRTTLVIAHRLSTIMNADEILVMEEGRIVERGKHSELLAKNGAYAQMWALQKTEDKEWESGAGNQ